MFGLFTRQADTETSPPAPPSGLSSGLGKLATLFHKRVTLDDDFLDELEMQLISADVSLEATDAILSEFQTATKSLTNADDIMPCFKQVLINQLQPLHQPVTLDQKPTTILVVGINGAGKTTTLGKLAHYFKQHNQAPMLAAGDTFRAAAVEQLKTWGERNQIPVVAQSTGSDAAAVIFDATQSASAKKVDILLADTAGRLHTQSGLMNELAKVKRVMQKVDENYPHHVWIVLDATLGQNAIQQIQSFHDTLGLTGIVLTKLDGSAKGGILLTIAQKFNIPVHFLGTGEQLQDLSPFDPSTFVTQLFTDHETSKY